MGQEGQMLVCDVSDLEMEHLHIHCLNRIVDNVCKSVCAVLNSVLAAEVRVLRTL